MQNNKNITIKPADKNLGLVVLPTLEYIKLCNIILNDEDTYEIINTFDFNIKAVIDLENILKKHDKYYALDKKNLSYLTKSLLQLYYKDDKTINVSKFYGLPKMHKNKLALRPIISNKNSITFYTSKYLHNVLFKLVNKLPTICYNSLDLIIQCENLTLNDRSTLLIADIDNMYPSIPIAYGLKAVKNVMIQYNYELDNIDLILELLAWVLNNNYMEFNNNVYKQIKGTAMGSPVSVSYANITIYYVEQKCLLLNPLLYVRYVDDIFCIAKDVDQAVQIQSTFNSVNIYICIKEYTIGRSGNFLDVEFYINDKNTIETKLYHKPINKFLYIPTTSLHKKHVIKNNITNEIKRIIMLNTSYSNALHDIKLFKNRLKDRGYSDIYLHYLFNPISFPSRYKLLCNYKSKHINSMNEYTTSNNKNSNNKNSNNLYIITTLPNIKFDKNLTEVFQLPASIDNVLNNPKLVIVNASKNNSINMALHHNKIICNQ
jgi:hypothetical protein